MIFEKATVQDISTLTELRIAYLQEDLYKVAQEARDKRLLYYAQRLQRAS